jgi:Uma2 family endonuclease
MLDSSMVEPEQTRPLKRAEYDRLVELGVFEDERIELLHGTLVTMSRNYPEHAGPIGRLTTILVPRLAGRADVRVQLPLLAADESEPEPDIAVVPLAPLYAASSFPEYWIVDVIGRKVHVFRDPVDGTYRTVTEHSGGETLRSLTFPDVEVAIREILPPE